MELIKAILLGAIQGLTEFLPVSSSGHLVIGSQLLNFKDQGVVFDVFVHLGTLLAVVIVFRRELLAMLLAPVQVINGTRTAEAEQYLKWDIYVFLATLPAVFVGLFFKDAVERLFESVVTAYLMLVATGVLMVSARYLPDRGSTLNWWRSILVGLAQACAILPGLSRSGSTIFAGMALGIPRQTIARFSFIMSVPAILGAAVLQFGELGTHPPDSNSIANLLAGTSMAALSGYFAIKLLLDIIEKNRLQWFGYYCLVIAGCGLAFSLTGS